MIDSLTNSKVEIAGYDTKETVKSNIPIGSSITSVNLPTGETILVRANEATIMGEDAKTLFSVNQMRENGVEVYDIAKRHGGLSCLRVEDYVITITLVFSMMTVKIRLSTKEELRECTMVYLTSVEQWNPGQYSDTDLDES